MSEFATLQTDITGIGSKVYGDINGFFAPTTVKNPASVTPVMNYAKWILVIIAMVIVVLLIGYGLRG